MLIWDETIRLANPKMAIVRNGTTFSYAMAEDLRDGAD